MMRSVLAGLLLCLCAVAAPAAEPWIEITDAWIREAPPGATVLAGYLRATNRSDAGLDIVAIHSEVFERIELHRTVIEEGVARMLPVARLEIAAGESAIHRYLGSMPESCALCPRSAPALTDKDVVDAKFALALGVDLLGSGQEENNE